MSELQESITTWIHQLKNGDPLAAQRLWESYFQRMVELARQRLGSAPKAVADEEDVALSAFYSFCVRAKDGQFTQLQDRTNLWPLLMVITANKSVDLIRKQNRQKRGGAGGPSPQGASGKSVNEPTVGDRPPRFDASSLSEIMSREPDPEFTVRMADELESLLRRLEKCRDPDLKQIALMKLEGYSAAEIGDSLGCARRSVERKLKLIGITWTSDSEEDCTLQ